MWGLNGVGNTDRFLVPVRVLLVEAFQLYAMKNVEATNSGLSI